MPVDPVVATPTRRLPVWAMGLANMPLGFVYGFISTAMGILLVSRGVPLAKVGAISGIAFSPTAWGFLLSPIVDVRFRKRVYAFLFAGTSACLLAAALLSIDRLTVFTVLLTLCCLSTVMFGSALGGLMPDVVGDEHYDVLSGWINVANLGAAGVFGALTVVAVRSLSIRSAAVCLCLLVFLPTLLLLRFPQTAKPEGTLRANFAAMLAATRRVFRDGRIWQGLVLFLLPECSFALTNLFSSMGRDFGVSERAVTTLNGPLVAVACSAGCLAAIPLCRLYKRRSVYLMAGVLGSVVALAIGVLPHTFAMYSAGVLGYNLCQGFSFTALMALSMEVTGARNAVAGTMMAILIAATNVPISFVMTPIDSRVHDAFGLRAMMFTDAGVTLAFVALLVLFVLPRMDRRQAKRLGLATA